MGDLRPVVPAGRRRDRWLPASITAVAFLVLVSIAKPWGRGAAPLTSFPSAASSPSPATAESTRPRSRGRYDPALFGQDAPDPAWQLWPAGYVVDLPTPWPVHYFHVIGIESPEASDVLGPWQAGVYRLALYGDGGVLIRSVIVSIDAPSTPEATPTAGG